jgi:hypothetical protein
MSLTRINTLYFGMLQLTLLLHFESRILGVHFVTREQQRNRNTKEMTAPSSR